MREGYKVCFWRPEFYGAMTTGGVAAMHLGQVTALNKLGHQSIYATAGKIILPEYVNVYHIPYSELLRNLPEIPALNYNRKAVNELKKIWKTENPDFLLQYHHDFIVGGTLMKRELGIPFFLHVDFIQYWVKKNWGKLYFSKLLKMAEEIQWANADAIVVVADITKNLLIENGIEPNKIVVNPNGVDTDIFNPDLIGINKINKLGLTGKFINGYVGTFGNYHGVEYLARSVKMVVDKIPEAFFLFVGDGELRPMVEEIIKKDNVEKNVLITGLVPLTEAPAYMNICDALHSPSVGNPDLPFFNSPLKLFEYMSMAKPVVASDVGQQSQVINNNINGLFCEEKSPESIAECIINLHKDKELSSRIGIKARQDAIDKWDWRVNVQRIINKYEELKFGK